MTNIPSSESARVARTSREFAGYALALAYVAIVGLSLWLQKEFAQSHNTALARAEAWTEGAQRCAGVTRQLATLYAAAIEPRGERYEKAKTDYLEAARQLRSRVEQSATGNEKGALLSELDTAMTEGEKVVANADQVFAVNQSEHPDRQQLQEHFTAMEQHHDAAAESFGRVTDLTRNLAASHFRTQEASADTIERFDLVVYGLLLLTIGGTTVFLYRLVRRMREEVDQKHRLTLQLRDSEKKYRSMFDNAIEGIFQTTPDGKFIIANKALAKMYGYKSPEHLIASLSDISEQLYVDSSQRAALLKALQKADVVSNFEFEAMRADGRTMWLRENVRAVRDEHGSLLYLEGTVEDVSDRWWSEQRRRLQYATTRVLSEAASVAEARPKILEAICEILEWKMGAVWDVDSAGGVLRCSEVWHRPEIDIAEFEEVTSEVTYKPGDGFAGEVWETGEPKWIANLEEAPATPSAELALAKGMGSAFGVPVKVNGSVLHVIEFFSPHIRIPDPELLQTLGMIGNQMGHLIERKNAEEALRKSEMRKAAILQSALDCIISFDLDGKIVEFNPAAERAFGYSQRDVIGSEMVELIIPESMRETHRRGIELFTATGPGNAAVGRRMELIAMRRDGREFPVEVAITRVDLRGAPLFTAYLRDITERKEAERITSELAAVVAHSNDAIIACTLDGKIRSWNVGAERIYGYASEEVVGQRLEMLYPNDRLDEFPQSLTAVKRGQSLANYETVRLRKDGKKISVSLTESPIRGENGRITGLSSIARDITDRKRLEEELLQSQKMDAIGRLAGGIAHDFNNILTAILGYSDLLIGQVDERNWMYKHLSEIRKAADLAATLTHQLLAFSRRQPLFLRVFSINDSVRNIQKMVQRLIGEHIHVITKFEAESGLLKADPGQLEQVLLNLCVNARDAMPHGGSITIATKDVTYLVDDLYSVNEMPAGEYVRLTVTDTGTGILPEVMKHIFEPFFTTKEKGQGTGLGLATCYGIVKQSGGYISVESGIGTGTTFSIYLPRVEESGEKSAIRKDSGDLPGGRETILYVEDEITVRSLTAHVLRRLGYTVLEASDGKGARDAVESQNGRSIDLLFSDVVLPDAGGKELSDWIRTRNQDTKILFTSGYVDENILRRHGLDMGIAFLQKPFTPADLAKKVREIIDGN